MTAWLAGDTASASNVELVLPATGVCSTDVERRRRMLLVTQIAQHDRRGLAGCGGDLRARDRGRRSHLRNRRPRPGRRSTRASSRSHAWSRVDEAGAVIGWAAASPVSTRAAYRGVIEHSVYVHRDARGQGLGRLLLDAFVSASDEAGFWTIQSSIFPENTASLRVHEARRVPRDRHAGADRAVSARRARRSVA